MHLKVEGSEREFTPIREFRAAFGLPPTFCVNTFEPKDFSGLGSLERAGERLNEVRRAVLDFLPERMPLQGWFHFLPALSRHFETQLYQINDQVGLRPMEIGFAVSGFADVCQAYVYALVRVRTVDPTALPPSFESVYYAWLNDSVRVSALNYPYPHQDQVWSVRIVTYAYGRVGMIVQEGEHRHYVVDTSLACPAEGFMMHLLREVIARFAAATV